MKKAQLYVMQRSDGLVKMGFSIHPQKRAEDIAKYPIWLGQVAFDVVWMSEPLTNARRAERMWKWLLGIPLHGKGSCETLSMPADEAIEWARLALMMA